MVKLPKVIRNMADFLALKQALKDPDENVRLEGAKSLFEIDGQTFDPSQQLLRGLGKMPFAVLMEGLDDPSPEKRIEWAREILTKCDPEGLRLLEKNPQLGIERAREFVREWERKVEEEGTLHPPN